MEICDICSYKCFGVDNNHGSCCTIGSRDWIIGPHHDFEKFIERLSTKYSRRILANEVLIFYEEGKKLFPDKNSWQDPENYPAIRLNLNDGRLCCVFYDNLSKNCSIYDIRPNTCKDFYCEYLKKNLDI